MSDAALHRKSGALADGTYTGALWKQQIIGLTFVAVFVGGLGYWMATTKIAGAVPAAGQFVSASDVKKVQHPNGGVIGALLVHDGDVVKEGDIVLRLDDKVLRSNFTAASAQLDELEVHRLRLIAERDDAPGLNVPSELAGRLGEPGLAKLLATEALLFRVRKEARVGERQQLEKRILQFQDQIDGLTAQMDAKEKEAEIIGKQLGGLEDLYQKGLAQISQLSVVQRDAATNKGQRGQIKAAIAEAEGRIAETRLNIIQIDENLRSETMRDLRDLQAKETELRERRAVADDQLQRVAVRAPTSGIVYQLAMHTVGGVLAAGEPAMLIVPSNDVLELEVHIGTQDIDQVSVGQTVRVKVLAGHQRDNPELIGQISRVTADAIHDEKRGISYYAARVIVPPDQVARLPNLRLLPGMQAEAFIETDERTPLEFMLKPIKDQMDHMFKER